MLEMKYVLSILWRCIAARKLTINFFLNQINQINIKILNKLSFHRVVG